MAVELFDLQQRTIVDSLETNDDDAIVKWLAAKDLIKEEGRSWSLKTSSGGKTNLAIRPKWDDPSERLGQEPYLEQLRRTFPFYRSYRHGLQEVGSAEEKIATETAIQLSEVRVRGAIAHCRMNDVSERDIVAILGEYADLAEF
jgi:hypothetical protein